MPLHLPGPCILCRLQWHRQQEPKQKFHHQSHGTQSPLLLWLPNCSQKHPQRNVLPPHQHVHQGSKREITPAPCHQNSTMCSMQSQLGFQMVQLHQRQFCQTNDCICRSQRHFLLGLFLCHILAKCLASALATNSSDVIKGSTATLHASFIPN